MSRRQVWARLDLASVRRVIVLQGIAEDRRLVTAARIRNRID